MGSFMRPPSLTRWNKSPFSPSSSTMTGVCTRRCVSGLHHIVSLTNVWNCSKPAVRSLQPRRERATTRRRTVMMFGWHRPRKISRSVSRPSRSSAWLALSSMSTRTATLRFASMSWALHTVHEEPAIGARRARRQSGCVRVGHRATHPARSLPRSHSDLASVSASRWTPLRLVDRRRRRENAPLWWEALSEISPGPVWFSEF
jgi:hypothetical protein